MLENQLTKAKKLVIKINRLDLFNYSDKHLEFNSS